MENESNPMDRNMAVTGFTLAVVIDFCAAIARTHPDPGALREAFVKERAASKHEITDPTPDIQAAMDHEDAHEQMLLRLLQR